MRPVVLSDRLTVSLGAPSPPQLADGARAPPPGGGPKIPPFSVRAMRRAAPSGTSPRFRGLPPPQGQVAHVLLALPPLARPILLTRAPARLACLIHAASVRSEPESNSQKNPSGGTRPPKLFDLLKIRSSGTSIIFVFPAPPPGRRPHGGRAPRGMRLRPFLKDQPRRLRGCPLLWRGGTH